MPLDQVDVDNIDEGPEMSFFDHLDELRKHILRSLLAIVSTGILLFVFKDWLFDSIIFAPADKDFFSYKVFCSISDAIGIGGTLCFEPPVFRTQAIGFAEAFVTAIKVSFLGGFIASFPYILYELWKFISPGLYDKERNNTRGIVFTCSILFLLGVSFGYFIIAPFAIKFLAGYTIPGVENSPTLGSLINYMVMFTLPAGLIFELPIVVYFLTKLGLVTPEGMRQYRRHAIIAILFLAAVITPPDVVTQFLIGIPLFILYEISIFVSKRELKRQIKKEEMESNLPAQQS